MTQPAQDLQRTRSRRPLKKLRGKGAKAQSLRTAIVERVIRFYTQSKQDRSKDRDRRLQRYAKFRGWTENKEGPWEGSSDAAYPDMTTGSLSTQDTLHNAIMSTRPIVAPRALNEQDRAKEDTVANLLDFQFFVEQPGEEVVGELIETFTNDGVMIAFVQWIRENRQVFDLEIFDPIPNEIIPTDYFQQLLNEKYPESSFIEKDEEGWDWEVTEDREGTSGPRTINVQFYTREKDDSVEMVIDTEVELFNGPKVIAKSYEQVHAPIRCANLQPPGPSNPEGARWVVLVDYPSIDDIAKLHKSGFYDLLTKKDMDKIRTLHKDKSDDQEEEQKDTFQGKTDNPDTKDKSHGTITRLQCFDLFDMDGDGINEDMVWWVLKEPGLLVRAKRLTEQYPSKTPDRPIETSNYLPVKGRWEGIGLLELMEGMHDFTKAALDMAVDNGTITTLPFGFYRPASNMKPEVLRPWPGDMYPLADPKNDVHYPQMQQGDSAFWFNLMAFAQDLQDKTTLKGDLQLGQVPVGQSSALRTDANLGRMLAQGEARPERVLRRFLRGVTAMFKRMHVLNTFQLPSKKRFLVVGVDEQGEDPYAVVQNPSEDLGGELVFDFHANIQNSSKAAMQQGLQGVMATTINELGVMLKITTPDTVYRQWRDLIKSVGLDHTQYIERPTPTADLEVNTAEEALHDILNSQLPLGKPAEGASQHLERLQKQMETEGLQQILQASPQIQAVLQEYLRQILFQAGQEQRLQAQAQAAQRAGGGQPGGNGQPPGQPSQGSSFPQVENNELFDESLPGAGGGAQ